MSSKLQRLISHYEAGRRLLEAELDEFISEKDYGMVHCWSKALMYTRQQLRTLQNLQDPLHDEKEVTHSRIARLEKLSQSELGRKQDYFIEWIAAEKLKLIALQGRAAEKSTTPQPKTLHWALNGLLESRIAAFALVLSDASRLYLNFRLLRRTLLISLPEVQRHRASHRLRKKQIRCLQGLGFRLYDRKDKLLLLLPFADAAAVSNVKSLLARMVFDCFYYKEFEGKSSLKYYEADAP